jgi:hypothetical protein
MLGATLGSAGFGAGACASGAFAAGFTSAGFISAGFTSAGLISVGLISVGLISDALASTGIGWSEILPRSWVCDAGASPGREIFGSTRLASTAAEADMAGAGDCKPKPARSRLNGVSSTATGSSDPFAEAAFGSRRLPNLNPIIPVSFPTDRHPQPIGLSPAGG